MRTIFEKKKLVNFKQYHFYRIPQFSLKHILFKSHSNS